MCDITFTKGDGAKASKDTTMTTEELKTIAIARLAVAQEFDDIILSHERNGDSKFEAEIDKIARTYDFKLSEADDGALFAYAPWRA